MIADKLHRCKISSQLPLSWNCTHRRHCKTPELSARCS